ncbi:N-6 DNA methylase [Streptomyces ehimensis]|uniref:site-specific DNA-methyltransferase (adenine-specific) n=1 Tax=Streptomyces ehimensis TaxID=68195 RepID=A0ABV9BDH2_9ACTN
MTQLDLFADVDATNEPPRPKTTAKIPATFASSKPATVPPTPAIKPAATPAPAASVRALRPRLPKNPHEVALRLAEAVSSAWHTQHGGTAIEVPIGIVAALALIRPKDPKGPDLARQILNQDDDQLIKMYREIWAGHWIQRPDLIDRARILHEWTNDDEHDKHRLYVTRAVTQAALRNGIFDLTGHDDPYFRAATDVLSPVMALTRSAGAQKGLGEYHTPAHVGEMIGHVVMAEAGFITRDPKPGDHIHDPACGSGGLLRAAAQGLRERGGDPASMRWSGVDIDPIAAACTAVNAIVWGLGPRVTVACADTLTRPDAVEEAMAEARAVIEHRDQLFGRAAVIGAVRKAQRLFDQVVAAA